MQEKALYDEEKRIQKRYDNELSLIEKTYKAKVEKLESEIKDIEDFLSKEGNIRNEAMRLIEGKSDDLYNRLMNWNVVYGDGLRTTVQSAWLDCYSAMDMYNQGQYNVLNTLEMLAQKLYEVKDIAGGLSGTVLDLEHSISTLSNTDNSVLSKWYDTLKSDEILGNFVSGIDLGDKWAGARRTYHSGDLNKYHNGGIVGASAIPEKYKAMFNLANNENLVINKVGEGYLTQTHMDNLSRNISTISKINNGSSVSVGDIIIQGNADSNTVALLKQERQNLLNEIDNRVFVNLNKLHRK